MDDLGQPLKLCPECAEKTRKRIDAVTAANPDKDVDWWVEFWDKEIERQVRTMRSHCDAVIYG